MIWEYHVTHNAAELHELGQAGWELVAVAPAAADTPPALYFKRPAPSFRERVTLEQQRHAYEQLGVALAGENP